MKPNILRTTFFGLFALLLSLSTSAQTITIRIGSHPGTLAWTPVQPEAAPTASAQVQNYVRAIMDAVGLKPNFEVRPARIDNAAAVVYSGQRYILYNPGFVDELVRKTGNQWAAVSVLAHEIGHHLDGHTVTAQGSQPRFELEADEFSGYVLRKMGASLADAQAAMRTLATAAPSRTHPGRDDRLASIAAGWNRASGQNSGSAAIARTPVPAPARPQAAQETAVVRRAPATTVLADRYILGRLSFHADPHSQYFVTTQYNVVKVTNNRLQVLGKMARLNNRSYPYVIYDNETKLLVQANGTVVSEQGRAVGRLASA
ncbi:hypothetical protein [Flaviaesturariibacter amylovorans]|uniref:Membrane-binding protein n=1 Tax=Flaviaesturariibacter amylovorans TaxID=1084520 RepID=A0ABP8GYK2_9BACT